MELDDLQIVVSRKADFEGIIFANPSLDQLLSHFRNVLEAQLNKVGRVAEDVDDLRQPKIQRLKKMFAGVCDEDPEVRQARMSFNHVQDVEIVQLEIEDLYLLKVRTELVDCVRDTNEAAAAEESLNDQLLQSEMLTSWKSAYFVEDVDIVVSFDPEAIQCRERVDDFGQKIVSVQCESLQVRKTSAQSQHLVVFEGVSSLNPQLLERRQLDLVQRSHTWHQAAERKFMEGSQVPKCPECPSCDIDIEVHVPGFLFCKSRGTRLLHSRLQKVFPATAGSSKSGAVCLFGP